MYFLQKSMLFTQFLSSRDYYVIVSSLCHLLADRCYLLPIYIIPSTSVKKAMWSV